ncbi:MAG: hypothetical protein WBI07_00180 [Mobilitalea sp.]
MNKIEKMLEKLYADIPSQTISQKVKPTLYQKTPQSKEMKSEKEVRPKDRLGTAIEEMKNSAVYGQNHMEAVNNFDFNISQKKLQEAVIWSEILGKPMCKREKRR